jgi:hypothetical protein
MIEVAARNDRSCYCRVAMLLYSRSRKDSGLTPTAAFALATPKAPLIGVGDGNYNFTCIANFFSILCCGRAQIWAYGGSLKTSETSLSGPTFEVTNGQTGVNVRLLAAL